MLWDPFLIKKLLKSVICGTVNSAWMHCSQLTKLTIDAEQKKKKGLLLINFVPYYYGCVWIELIFAETEN